METFLVLNGLELHASVDESERIIWHWPPASLLATNFLHGFGYILDRCPKSNFALQQTAGKPQYLKRQWICRRTMVLAGRR